MPTVLKFGPYRFFFYAGGRSEPVHIHVERDNNIAKFWLYPVMLQDSGGFDRPEIAKIHRLVSTNQKTFVEAWNDYFGY